MGLPCPPSMSYHMRHRSGCLSHPAGTDASGHPFRRQPPPFGVALVYVRQSTLVQVRDHTESTARHYALVDEATRLGWPRARVEVIDADLGVSGASTQGRDGFRKLVARVCLGEVGAVFGLEVSRLARSSADLSRLLELARLTDTLVIDGDGVYDLADFNDRLLLGLKGTMSGATRSRTMQANAPMGGSMVKV